MLLDGCNIIYLEETIQYSSTRSYELSSAHFLPRRSNLIISDCWFYIYITCVCVRCTAVYPTAAARVQMSITFSAFFLLFPPLRELTFRSIYQCGFASSVFQWKNCRRNWLHDEGKRKTAPPAATWSSINTPILYTLICGPHLIIIRAGGGRSAVLVNNEWIDIWEKK